MNDLHHIREIEHVFQGHAAARPAVVVESWLRCINQHGLDPSLRAPAHIVTDRELREHRQRTEDLINIARFGIERLYALMAGQNYVLLLSNRAGVTVEYLGDEAQKSALRRGGLYLGAEWSEARAGTCAVGACLETGEALIIHQSDHFDATHGGLSCTAAPIYDSRGGLVAALDISLLSAPQPRASQSMALHLVQQTVRRIELANLMAESRRDWVLRLAGSPDFLDVDPEAAISLSGDGRILGATHQGMRLLAQASGQDWRAGASLIGRPLTDFLNVSQSGLEELTRDRPAAERLLETRDGHRIFAHAIEPRPAMSRAVYSRSAAPSAPIPAPLRKLTEADPGMEDVLANAAMALQSHLPMLLTGPTGAGKLTLAHALHEASGRGPLMVISAEDLSDPDSEAQLLGRHGSKEERGLLADLDGGTLIIRHVEALSPRLQARLTRLIGEGGYVPLGGLRAVPLQLQLIALSQLDPAELLAEGRLRAEFYHRLCGAGLHLPPLSERRDLHWLLVQMLRQNGAAFGLPGDLMRAVAEYSWPGNLHELRQFAARLAAGGAQAAPGLLALLTPEPANARQSQGAEAALLAGMLKASGGNISLCARRMGVDRTTIHRRMRRFGLEIGRVM